MKKITEKDYIKAVRRSERETEIEYYGKQVSMRPTKISKSKKTYSRKNFKIANRDF